MNKTLKDGVGQKRTLILLLVALLLSPPLKAQQDTLTMKLTVHDLFNLADSNSKAIKLSLAGIEVAAANVEKARTSKLPTLGFSASAGYLGNADVIGLGNLPSGSYDMPHFSNSYGLQASYVVFAGGNINRSIDIATLQQQLAGLNYQNNRMDVRLMLVGTFMDLYVAQNQREVYKKNIEQTRKLLSTMENRLQKGVLLRSDVLRTQLQLSNFTFGLSKVENHISVLNKKLTETLGLPERTRIVTADKLAAPALSADTSSLNGNVDIKESDIQTKVAEKYTDVVKAKRMPTVALFGNSNLSRPFIYDLPALDIYANVWTAGVSVSFNIDALYTNRKAIKHAEAQVQQSHLAKDLTEEHVKLNLHEAYVNYKESMEQLSVAHTELSLATDNYNLVVNRYNRQLALITDVMDASTAQLRAELQIENAEAAISFSIYKIQRILGEL